MLMWHVFVLRKTGTLCDVDERKQESSGENVSVVVLSLISLQTQKKKSTNLSGLLFSHL